MNFNRIRAVALTTFATLALVSVAGIGGASAAEPDTGHDAGTSATASVVHVSGSTIASQTIYETTANGGYLVGLGI